MIARAGDDLVLVARLWDRSGALERLLGLLRRRALQVRTVSVYRADERTLEVVVAFDSLQTAHARIGAELRDLEDLEQIRRLGSDEHDEGREMALASISGPVGDWPEACLHMVRRETDTRVELVGSPAQIDCALAFLTARGVLEASTRSGVMLAPARKCTLRSNDI